MMDDLAAPRPVTIAARIDTLDLLRGVAICGILLMNIPLMGLIGDRAGPSLPARWNADWISWGVQSVVFEGTMRGLFTMLFGAGMLLMLRRSEGHAPSVAPFDIWARRCLALMALGIVQWTIFIWPGEILFLYGVSGLFLLAWRTARPRGLLISAAILLLALSTLGGAKSHARYTLLQASIPAAVAQAAGKSLTERQQAALKAVAKSRAELHPAPAAIRKETIERTHLPSLLGWSWGIWSRYNIGVELWEGIFESVGFMLIGMALYRTAILTGAASSGTYAWMMAIGYGVGIPVRLFMLWWGSRTGYDLDVTRMNPIYSVLHGFAYEPVRLLITLGHVGLLAALWRGGVLGRAVTLRALGRMALTVYSLQSILTSILFYALGFVGMFGFATLMGISVLIWIVTAAFCRFWLARYAMGPAEAALRAIAYNSFGPRQRRAAVTALADAPAV